MGDSRQVLLQAAYQVALHDLPVIEVELQPQVPVPRPRDRRQGLVRGLQQEARVVAAVERLDHDRDPLGRAALGGVAQVGGEDLGAVARRQPARGRAGQHVDPAAVKRPAVGDRLLDTLPELRLAAGQTRGPGLARRQVAGRDVDQHDLDAGGPRPRRHGLGRVVVGELQVDRAEAQVGRRREAVEEGMFRQHEAGVDRKTWHVVPGAGRAPRAALRGCRRRRAGARM